MATSDTKDGDAPKSARGVEIAVGRTFGQWTVLSRHTGARGRTMWLCRCSCGERRTLQGSSLRSGKSRSCGCYKAAAMSRRRLHDLTGRRFGAWTVLARADATVGTRPLWLCECACGHRRSVDGSSLRAGRSKSCGRCDRP